MRPIGNPKLKRGVGHEVGMFSRLGYPEKTGMEGVGYLVRWSAYH